MNLAIIVGMASADFGMGRLGRKGAERAAEKGAGTLARRGAGRIATRASARIAGKGGAKLASKIGSKALKVIPFLGAGLAITEGIMRIRDGDYVGGLLSFGSAIPVAGWAFLALDIAREFMGGKEFDKTVGRAFGGKPGLTDKQVKKGTPHMSGPSIVTGLAEGGVTRSKQPRRGVKRTVSKKGRYRRRLTPQKPGDVEANSPGADVGGEKKLFDLFPDPFKMFQKAADVMNPFKVIQKAGQNLGDSDYFGPILSITSKILLGQKPTQQDYKNVGLGINMLVNKGIDDGKLKGGLAAFAEGGFVDPKTLDAISQGGDISDWVAKSFKDATETNAQKTLREIQENLKLRKEGAGPDKSDPTEQIDEGPFEGGAGGQWGPLLDLIAGKESGGNYEAMYPSTVLKGATKMTIAEVARRATGAVGKYQQLPQYLVSRAKAAGLNPDKDLYSPENQDLIITKVNIEGNRSGRRWLKGEISDEQFMQGLSQEFASLPNAQGKFYYPGQRSSMTADKVKSALSAVKKGGYTARSSGSRGGYMGEKGSLGGSVAEYITGDPNTPFGRFDRGGHGLPSNYHDHIAFRDRNTAVRAYKFFQSKGIQVTEFKGFNPVGGHASGSYHYSGLAFDVPGAQWGGSGAIGARDYAGSAKVRKTLKEFLGGSIAKFEKGGMTLGRPHLALVGEKGKEFVIDADSTAAIEQTFPGFLGAINTAKYDQAISVLRNFASYESGSEQVVVIASAPTDATSQGYDDSTSGSSVYVGGGEEESDPFSTLYQGG